MKKAITIHQRPNTRSKKEGAEGFTKEFVISSGDTAVLAQAVEYDNVLAKYEGGYRAGKNFLSANGILADIDNTHSDNPADWINPEDVAAALAGVEHYYYPSRNHMKLKDGKVARPKYHFIFPSDDITSAEEYAGLMKRLIKALPDLHFDESVSGAAQLNFGVEGAQVVYVDGEKNLTDFITTIDVIPQGRRHSTLISYGASVLKRYGDEDGKAYQAFTEKAAKCSPPMDESELTSIWNSALSFYNQTIKADPEYVQPKHYNKARQQNQWELNSVDPKALKVIYSKGEPSERRLSIADTRLLLQAFGVVIRINDMDKHGEIVGLPPEYSGEDSWNLLATLLYDTASKIGFRCSFSSFVHEFLNVIANENRYHPVIELLNSEPWDGVDRLPELYRIMGLSDNFYKTLVRKWALQTVAVLYNTADNPISAEGVLVLQGAQGIGKTYLFRHLAIKDKFFNDGASLDTRDKDTLMSATKVWICELGELDSTTKREQSEVKAFLTKRVDRYREPYARCEVVRPRRTSFCGTVNPKNYLRDETGNRRFWTIPVENIDIKKIFEYPPEWYAHFWRQIHTEYMSDKKGYLLTREEQDRVNEGNKDFETELYGEDEFMSLFLIEADKNDWQWLTAAEIAKKLNEHYKGLNMRSESIGRRLIPRLEKRIGKPFERKTVKGKRLILCPQTEFNYTISSESVLEASGNADSNFPPELRHNDLVAKGEEEPKF